MSDNTYDYIVVGAGSAGCVVAARLSEDPKTRVLVLEAGGRDRHLLLKMPLGFHGHRYPGVMWPLESEPEAALGGRRVPLPRGRIVGGSSMVNGMLYSRGHPRDYDQWRQMGCEGWGFADVLPYFKRSEQSWRGAGPYHGGSGPMAVSPVDARRVMFQPVAEAARHCGYPVSEDLHGEEAEGFAVPETTTGRGRRASAYSAFLEPAMARRNLTVLTGAVSTKVLFEGRRAIGIEYERDGARHVAHAKREVVLSGGAYHSPHLLMLSGVGPADALRDVGIQPLHDLPGVGANLSEHASCFINFATDGPVSFLKELRADKVALAMLQWLLFGRGLLASQGSSANAVIRTRPELERPDIQFFFNPVRVDAEVWFPWIKPPQEHQISAIVILLHPESRGRVSLRSADPHAPPRIELNLLSQRADIDTMIRGLRIARRIFETPPMRDLVAKELAPGSEARSDARLEAYLREAVNTSHHPVGSCAMGRSPGAVVDPQLRVHGIERLRVADASIMPSVPGGNTNAPSIMIGEKAADLIRGRTLQVAEL